MSDNDASTPTDVQALLDNEAFARRLPPMGNGARQFLALKDEEREDPRLLSLLTQKDPVYLGQVLSLANSALFYMPGGSVSTADAAIRRIGVRDTYDVLLACAMATSFPEQTNFRPQRRYLLNYTVSVCLTSKKFAAWLRLDADKATNLMLGSLLSVSGLFAGLLAGGSVSERFGRVLGDMGSNANLRERPELKGFCLLSQKVARLWTCPPHICDAIADSGAARPAGPDSALLATVESLVHAKATGANQKDSLQMVESSLPRATSHIEQVDLGVFLT
jgi:HD-like signal output (HDOD) protein